MNSTSGHGFKKQWLIIVIVTQLLILFAPTLIWLLDRWTMDVWYNGHGLLVMIVLLYWIRQEILKLRELPSSANFKGFYILIPALMLHVIDAGVHSQLLSAVALFLSLPGFSLLLLGTERTRKITFPLVMMFLTLPIPLVFTESIQLLLRHISANSVAFILPYLGVPVFSTGTVLQIPNGALQVADACSGFSILYATVTVALLTANFCPTNLRRVLVLLVAAPLAIFVNIVRVLILTLLVHWISLDVLKTAAHEISGLLTFAIALPTIFWLGQISFGDGERKE